MLPRTLADVLDHCEVFQAGRELLAASSPPARTTTVLTNEMINTINADVHAAQNALDAALSAHQQIAARLPLSQVNPGQKVLDTETKLIHHAIRIAAFNASQALARAIITHTGYTRAHDEAHSLIRTALAASGDIIPNPDTHTLHIRLDPLPAPTHRRHRRALPHPQRNQNRLPRHQPHDALQHQIPPITTHQFLNYVWSPGGAARCGAVERTNAGATSVTPLRCDGRIRSVLGLGSGLGLVGGFRSVRGFRFARRCLRIG
ncbi:hypothetical protein [Mycobacterium sp.]|uniref:hypothetical protein n=1 Tax=Mycobacterium sp. TaxID=1785 RepID=UPI003BA93377